MPSLLPNFVSKYDVARGSVFQSCNDAQQRTLTRTASTEQRGDTSQRQLMRDIELKTPEAQANINAKYRHCLLTDPDRKAPIQAIDEEKHTERKDDEASGECMRVGVIDRLDMLVDGN